MKQRTIAAELEFFGSHADGTPVDFNNCVKRLNERVNGSNLGKICFEPGPGAGEVAAMYAGGVGGAIHNVRELLKIVEGDGICVQFGYRSPFQPNGFWASCNPRHRAIREAAKLEVIALGGTEADAGLIGRMAEHAATHIHIRFDRMPVTQDLIPQPVLYTVAALNLLAFRIGKIFCRKYGMVNAGHGGIWDGFANPVRFPQYGEWDENFLAFRRRFESIKRLIRCMAGDKTSSDAVWVVDLKDDFRWGNHHDEGMFWKACRPRSEFGTFEFRGLPSMHPDILEPVMTEFDDLVAFLIQVFQNSHIPTFDALLASGEWRSICSFPIAQYETVPLDYDPEMWRRDKFE